MKDETEPSLSTHGVLVNTGEPLPCHRQPCTCGSRPCCLCCEGWACWKTSLCVVCSTAMISAVVFALFIWWVVENVRFGHGRPFLVDGHALTALPADGASSDWWAKPGEL